MTVYGKSWDEALAEKLLAGGKSYREVGKIVGVHHSTIQRRFPGNKQVDGHPPLTPKLKKAKELLEQGMSYTRVAKTVGSSRETLSKHFPELGRHPNPKGDRERVREMFDMGMSDEEMASVMKRTKGAITKIRLGMGLKRGEYTGGERVAEEEVAEWRSLLEEGYSYSAIGGMKGRMPETIMRHIPGYKKTPQERGEIAMLIRWGGRSLEGLQWWDKRKAVEAL